MTRTPWLLSILAAMSLSVAQAASLHKGQVLYEHGMLEDAKHALVDVMTSDSTDDEKAGALYLLGTIAIKQQHYPIAARMWSDLIQRYPGSAEAREAGRRLPSIPNSVQSSKVRVEAPEGTAPPDPVQGVLVTGTSAELKYAGQMVKDITNLLNAHGVPVARTPSAEVGPNNVLVLALRFGQQDSLQADCFSSEGKLLWSEKATAFLGMSKASITEKLVDRIKGSIEPHIGDSCLPKL
jgi:hypothetical protein